MTGSDGRTPADPRACLRIGTAGWAVASRYAAEVPGGGSHLARYAQRLNAAEINTSFYRPHRREIYARWADAVPPSFRFAVKLPKAITHERRLQDCVTLIDAFLSQAEGLGEKLGVLLVQLPPSLALDDDVAKRFFGALASRSPAPVACEPRHASWFTAAANAFLRVCGVARVAADPPRAAGGDEPGGFPDRCAYWRLHGSPRIYVSAYDPQRLAALRRRLDMTRAAGVTAWCIFDNTAASAALGDAMAVSGCDAPGAVTEGREPP